MTDTREKGPVTAYRTYGRGRSVRRAPENYAAPDTTYFVTACCLDRHAYCSDARVAAAVLTAWRDVAAHRSWRCWALCVMPDHVHALVTSGPDGGDSLGQLVSAAKSWSLRQIPDGAPLRWQKKYHDHIVRPEEDPKVLAEYILNNPVRGNLVNDWQDWPWKHIDEDLLL